MKFKTGDKVRVKKFETRPKNWNHDGEMDHLMGKIVTIVCVVDHEDGYYIYDEEKDCHWALGEDHVESVNDVIVIYCENGNVIARDENTHKEVTVICRPEDTFDFEIYAKFAFERLMADLTIKVGDKVKVVDCHEVYATYVDWVEQNIRDERDLRYKLDYGKKPNETHNYVVKCVAKHLHRNDTLVYIEDLHTGRCYIMDIKGLKKC